MSRRVLILGSTGSIGTQTLDVIRTLNQHEPRFDVVGLAAGSNLELLTEQVLEFEPGCAALHNANRLSELQSNLDQTGCTLMSDAEGVLETIQTSEPDIIVNAIVGAAGLKPLLEALKLNIDVALANKESLVIAGELVQKTLRSSQSQLIPLDSEHNALFQLLDGRSPESIHKLIVTASGGALRDLPIDELPGVTPAQVLKHPNWEMGARITVDSATLVNKAFEVIEAKWLFGADWNQVEAVVHPQSTIHGIAELVDGALLAYMGSPDMKTPIQHALCYPEPPSHSFERLDWQSLDLQLKAIDHNRYPSFNLVIEAGQMGGTAPAVINAADEVAVDRFLEDDIAFPKIDGILRDVLEQHEVQKEPSLEDLLECDRWAREIASNL